MMLLQAETSQLVLVDLQQRLMPAIDGAEAVVANALRLRRAAALLQVPVLVTEQNPQGLGRTDPQLDVAGLPLLEKMHFDATREDGWTGLVGGGNRVLVVAGCEAHVCVLQTVLGALGRGHRVALVADAVGSRTPANRDAAVVRAVAAGAIAVTTEMVLFEWLESCRHPRFKQVLSLVK